jgi:hypothetical protein
MADLEVAKHTKKVYKIWNNKHYSFWHKLKEFFIEIIIIVFAVSISIWFHNISEHNHEKKEAIVFLTGLQSDLIKDITEMQQDSLSFVEQQNYFKFLIDGANTNYDSALLMDRRFLFTNITVLLPNISRFEALKYAGKMKIIENTELLDEIISLYEEQIPVLLTSAKKFAVDKEINVVSILDKNRLLQRGSYKELKQILQQNEDLKYQIKRRQNEINYILDEYHLLINQHRKLVNLITIELKHLN